MGALRHAFVLIFALLLAACGPASWASTPPTGQPVVDDDAGIARGPASLEDVLRTAEVTEEEACLPDLSEDELAAIVRMAQQANPGASIRRVLHRYAFHSPDRRVRVSYAPHQLEGRTRHYYSITLAYEPKDEKGQCRAAADRWRYRGKTPSLTRNREVCPPWRSFVGGLPPLDSELMDLWDTDFLFAEIDEADVLGLLDAVRPLIPARERLFTITPLEDRIREVYEEHGDHFTPGADYYEVDSVEGCGGACFRVEHDRGRWTAKLWGEWIS